MTQQPPPGWQPGGPSQPPQSGQPQWPHPHQGPQFAAPGSQPSGPPGSAPYPGPYPGQPGPAPTQSAPKSKTPMLIAGVVALALVIGGVVFALNFFRGATPEAAKGLPGDVLGAIELNLAPAPSDQLELSRIINKFPVPEEMSGTTDYKQALWDLFFSGEADAPDFETDVKPWLGDALALGFMQLPDEALGSDGIVLAIETTDRRKATAFAEAELREAQRFFFVDDVMVITGSGNPLDEATIKNGSLADDEGYRADLAKLGGNPLATGWFGPRAMEQIMQEAQRDGVAVSGAQLEQLRDARGAFGLKVAANKLSFDTSMYTPHQPEADLSDVSRFAGDLPATGLAAFAMSATTESYEQLWQLTDAAPEARDALQQFGITSPADLEALFGQEVGITVGYDDNTATPTIGATFVSKDAARQQELINRIAPDLQAVAGGPPVHFEQHGDTAHLAFGQGLDAVRDPAARLKDSDHYQSVVEGSAESVFFLDVNAIRQLALYQQLAGQFDDSGSLSQWVEPFAAVGVTGSAGSDHYSDGSFQIIFN